MKTHQDRTWHSKGSPPHRLAVRPLTLQIDALFNVQCQESPRVSNGPLPGQGCGAQLSELKGYSKGQDPGPERGHGQLDAV